MTRAQSLARRAVLALLLMVGFYALALAISAALLAVPVLEYRYLHRVHPQLALACLGAAGAVLWSLVPRRDRFEPPGPRLHPSRYPAFFALVDDVARVTKQAMPDEVYALNDVNAFVTHRGGVMGVGSRRVLGVGLPLVQHLSTAELKAVIGHEFGHYDSGDVALGPWIYKTRAAIGRTIAGMTERQWLAKPFEWYGQLFLRVTYAVSRQQEFVADAVGARVAGRQAMGRALERVAALAPAYSRYLDEYVGPAAHAGKVPPLLDGFRRFVHGSESQKWIAQAVEAEATFGETSLYDTHPSLKDRLASLATHPEGPHAAQDPPAAALVPDADRLAQQMIERAIREHTGTAPQPLAWDDLGRVVVVPSWREALEAYGTWLTLPAIDALPSGREGWLALRAAGAHEALDETPDEVVLALFVSVATAAVGLALSDRGWTVVSAPGEASRLVHGEHTLVPRQALDDLSQGVTSAETWQATCHALALAGVPLAPPRGTK